MKTVVVLGCYRSATSLIAKGLHLADVHMGDRLIPASQGNPWGYWEDYDFVILSDRILGAAGGAWDDPPSRQDILDVAPEFTSTISAMMVQKEKKAKELGKKAWGWKDPRTVLTYPAFQPFLVDPVLVIVRRDTPEIVDSLCRRDGIDPGSVEKLTEIYLDRLTEIAESREPYR